MAHSEVFVVVTDEGLYTGTGMVHRWLRGVTNTLYHSIVAEAPERSGELKAGITPGFIQHEGSLRILSGTVESTAPHTLFVIRGTAGQGEGYIYRNDAARTSPLVRRYLNGGRVQGEQLRGMWMRFSNPYPPRTLALRVKGQRPNNFMLKGYNRTARRHRALHPIFPGFG